MDFSGESQTVDAVHPGVFRVTHLDDSACNKTFVGNLLGN